MENYMKLSINEKISYKGYLMGVYRKTYDVVKEFHMFTVDVMKDRITSGAKKGMMYGNYNYVSKQPTS